MNAHAPSKAPPATDERRRWIALYVLCAGMLMIVLDVTVVNVALPSIQSDLGFSGSSLAWVVNAYLISFGGLLLLAGRFGDLLGHRRVFLAGLVVFTSASMVCGLAGSQEVLVGARFVQGLGGAMTSAVILGMIVTMFPEPREQAKAIGVYGFVASAGGSIGLLAGGVLTQAIDWHWIFFINVPIGIITATLAVRLLEPGRGVGLDQGADVPGALLLVTSLMLGVYTIVVPAARHGWGAGDTLGLGGASLALLVGFLLREAMAARPLIPPRVFRSRELAIRRPLARSDLPGLYRRACAALERCRDGVLICDVSAVPVDGVAVEALARLALGARRHRCRVQLRGSTAELDALIELVGLGETLSLRTSAADRTTGTASAY
jgi:MFS family permease